MSLIVGGILLFILGIIFIAFYGNPESIEDPNSMNGFDVIGSWIVVFSALPILIGMLKVVTELT